MITAIFYFVIAKLRVLNFMLKANLKIAHKSYLFKESNVLIGKFHKIKDNIYLNNFY